MGNTDYITSWTWGEGHSLLIIGFLAIFLLRRKIPPLARKKVKNEDESSRPVSVNYHFTRQCNYHCGFCFHTAKTSYVLPIDEAKRGLRMLKEGGKP